eukprot:maker-scaffold_5-snap-gene-7.5-mRNA-1 protein AED:0.00 eAED:0.00 QI:125/1/1/1/1/1/2/1032/238
MGNNPSRKKSKKKGQALETPQVADTQPAAANSVLSAAQKVKSTIRRLEKRKAFVEKRIERETEAAKKEVKAKNKKRALLHLKKKKAFENDVMKLDGMILNLEQQSLAIESGSVTYDVVDAMKTGLNAQKKINKEIDVEKTDDLMADIKDMQDEANEVSELLAEPVEDLELDDELMNELAEMESDGVKTEAQPVQQPVAAPAAAAPEVQLPDAPQHEIKVSKPVNEDEAALNALMAEMQ